ncbi:MAG TPA: FAD:protein FMN transferase [Planctomycetota bacterium]|nr:FAD:protein FMN transferase [Planctomycetota bacterium]
MTGAAREDRERALPARRTVAIVPARRVVGSARRAAGTARAGALAALVILLALARPAAAGDDTTVYLDKSGAIEAVLPDAARVVELRHVLAPGETRAIEALLGRRLEEGGFFLYAAWADAAPAEPTGYAIIVAEIGKVRPITHIVSVTPAGVVAKAAVMIYRESHGGEVASGRFMAQYEGKSLADPLSLDKDIINIAGSTLSGHAICRGVRKALAVVKTVLLDRSPEERAALLAAGTDVTPVHAAGGGVMPARAAGGAATERGAAGDATGSATAGEPASLFEALPDGTRVEVLGPGRLRVARAIMGSECSIEAFATPGGDDAGARTADAEADDGAGGAADAALRGALLAALDAVSHWDGVLSDWRPDTPLSRLNAAPAGLTADVDPELLAWLDDSRHWRDVTDGAFDPAVGALVAAWGLRTVAPARPAPDVLAAALARSSLRFVRLDVPARTVTRDADGLLLDPGASGKGWALDRAAEVLLARGVTCALLSFRSTLVALAPPPGADGWPVPVVHDGSGAVVAQIPLAHGALSVSGGGFSTFEDGGVLRGHVIDPSTGVPVPAGRLAWVLHGNGAASDALSTALLVRGAGLPAVDGARGGFMEDADAAPVAWPAHP